MSYNSPTWTNGSGTPISAANLQALTDAAELALQVTRSATPPSSPGDGQLWIDTSVTGGAGGEIVNFSSSNSAAANRTALIAALDESSAHYYVAPGDYAVENNTLLQFDNFSGVLEFAPGARLVFSNSGIGGLYFLGGTRPRFIGVRTAFATLPTVRVDGATAFGISSATEPLVFRSEVHGSAAAGLVFELCTKPRYLFGYVHNTMADGTMFANCADIQLDHYVSEDTGDDGLSILNYTGGTDNRGGYCQDVMIRRSDARGIAIVGGKDITVDGWDVDGTTGSAIIISTDPNPPALRVPENITAINGRIENAGARAGSVGGKNGIEVDSCAGNVRVQAEVISATEKGCYVAQCLSGKATIEVQVRQAGQSGIECGVNQHLEVRNCIAENTNGWGANLWGNELVVIDDLTLKNTSLTDGGKRALTVENYSGSSFGTCRVMAEGIKIVDTAGTPTGYKVHTIENAGASRFLRGDLGVVHWVMAAAFPDAPGAYIDGVLARRRYSGAQSSTGTTAPASGFWLVGDVVEPPSPAANSVLLYRCVTSGAPGTWEPLYPGRQKVVLGSDVATAVTTFGDVTGLSVAVLSGVIYRFRATIIYTVNAATTGSAFSVNGPATPTQLAFNVTRPSVTATYPQAASVTGAKAYDTPPATTATPETTGNVAIVEGIIQPSANGTLAVRFASEVAVASGVTAKAGSTLEVF